MFRFNIKTPKGEMQMFTIKGWTGKENAWSVHSSKVVVYWLVSVFSDTILISVVYVDKKICFTFTL